MAEMNISQLIICVLNVVISFNAKVMLSSKMYTFELELESESILQQLIKQNKDELTLTHRRRNLLENIQMFSENVWRWLLITCWFTQISGSKFQAWGPAYQNARRP